MTLVVGLGNPGEQYNKSRHNAGFYTIDKIKEKLSGEYSKCANYIYFDYFSDGKKTRFIKPQTFMNLSGEIFNSLRSEKIDDLIVIVDNIDLQLGKIRFKVAGSSAGHNGLKSIIEHYSKGSDFYRMYIGAGREENESAKSVVLKKLSDELFIELQNSCTKAADVILDFLKNRDIENTKKMCANPDEVKN